MSDHGVEIKKLYKEGKLVLGTSVTYKKLKSGELSQVFVSQNCPEEVLNELSYYAEVAKVELVPVSLTNEEIGVLCKKPFFISVIGVLR